MVNFSKLIWAEPWLGPIVLNLAQVVETAQIPTAAVTPDGKTLTINPQFWKSLRPNERLGLLLHEMLHIACRHAARRESRDRALWNIACDMAINAQITASGYTLPAGALPGENAAAETIYEHLWSARKNKSAAKNNGALSSSGAGSAAGDDHHASEKAQIARDLLAQNADGTTHSESPATLEALAHAAALAKSGTTPLARHFQPAPAKGDWRTVLSRLVKSALGDDVDYLAYTFDEWGIAEDVLMPKPVQKICVLVDESASITGALYAQFLGELEKMASFASILVSGFAAGTALAAVPLHKYRRSMTGGTDVRPAYAQACQLDFSAIIVLTDGLLEFPLRETVPTIWALPKSYGRKMEVIL